MSSPEADSFTLATQSRFSFYIVKYKTGRHKRVPLFHFFAVVTLFWESFWCLEKVPFNFLIFCHKADGKESQKVTPFRAPVWSLFGFFEYCGRVYLTLWSFCAIFGFKRSPTFDVGLFICILAERMINTNLSCATHDFSSTHTYLHIKQWNNSNILSRSLTK